MQNFLTKSAPGLLAIVTVAGLGYFVPTAPTATAARPAAAEIEYHGADCLVCRLTLNGRGAQASKLGPDSSASADAAEATHQGTIRK
jgi:hypothetical protein